MTLLSAAIVLGAVLLVPNSLRTVSSSRAARFVAWIRARSSCVTVRVSCRPYANPLETSPRITSATIISMRVNPASSRAGLTHLDARAAMNDVDSTVFSSTGCRRHLINHHRSVEGLSVKNRPPAGRIFTQTMPNRGRLRV